MTDLLAVEFLKLRTTKTAWVLLGATLGLTALAVVGAIFVADNASLNLESERGIRTVLHVSASGAVFMLVFGIIISAGEYRHSTATDTFLTSPRRSRVMIAKLVTAGTVGVAFGALSAGIAIAFASRIYALKGYTFPLESSDAWTILGGAVLYAAFFGTFGAATGSLVRNQVGGNVGWLAWLFVAENIVLGIAPRLGRWLPATAGRALVRDPDGDLLGQPAAAMILVAYGIAITAVAVYSERGRDA